MLKMLARHVLWKGLGRLLGRRVTRWIRDYRTARQMVRMARRMGR
jgi:hypothetical protein